LRKSCISRKPRAISISKTRRTSSELGLSQGGE
jgi:hypothetical protein